MLVFAGEEKSAADVEQELFYHIVVDGQEQIVKPEQAAVVTRVLEAIYRSVRAERQFTLIEGKGDYGGKKIKTAAV